MTDISVLLQKNGILFTEDYDLSKASSFNIGGKADIAIFPKSEEALLTSIQICKDSNTKFNIIGNGSNVLFSDDGFRGAIIFTKSINEVSIENDTIIASCGAKLTSLSVLAKKYSLSGLEFAFGIPGTIGGAVVMNAGAYGSEISNILISSRALDTNIMSVINLSSNEHNFSYRNSIYLKKSNLICIGASLKLTNANDADIEKLMRKNSEIRKKSQPLDYPNAGSYFKRPEGHFAAKLIDDCSLKGVSVGGAQVSRKHAGFIINTGNATAKDVLELANIIKRTVFEQYGIMLESEVKYID